MMEEELKYHQQFMDGFLKAIRTSNDADVHHIIDVVRSKCDFREGRAAWNFGCKILGVWCGAGQFSAEEQ